MASFNKNINELEFEKIFKPGTLQKLKTQTAARKQQMLGDKNALRAATSTPGLVRQLNQIEKPYKDGLEQVALDVVYDLYPRLQRLVEDGKVKIDAKLIDFGFSPPSPPPSAQGTIKDNPLYKEETPEEIEIAKRRIINSITQGGSIKGAFGFLYSDIKDNLDAIEEGLMDKYKEFLNLTFGSYADDQVVAAFLAQIAQMGGEGMGAGKVQGRWISGKGDIQNPYDISSEDENEDENKGDEEYYLIEARGACFAILIHEILKGYFEYMAYAGFSPKKTKQRNVAIVGAADKLINEPKDIQTGPEIYQAISDIFNNSNYDDLRIRDLFFEKVYELDDKPFIEFVENAINGELTAEQTNWIEKTMSKLSLKLAGEEAGIDLGGDDEGENEDEDQFV
jgi:hypothetical protein